MLTSIIAVTITAPDLSAIEAAYTTHLHYQVVTRGKLSSQSAALWNAPQVAGRDYLLLQPQSGEDVFLRFVQSDSATGYASMRSTGWNAAEILVKDPHQLAETLAASPFRIIGPPRGLSSNENIVAMQASGPAGELLYLTCIPPDEKLFNLGSAKTEIDRVFIVVLGGHNLGALREFYASQLQMPVSEPVNVRISVLSNAYGMNPEHPHQIALAQMPERFLIELDEYPAEAAPRSQPSGELPPGIAMVSFEVETLDAFSIDFVAPAAPMPDKPYNNKKAALITGAAGEWIELIERQR